MPPHLTKEVTRPPNDSRSLVVGFHSTHSLIHDRGRLQTKTWLQCFMFVPWLCVVKVFNSNLAMPEMLVSFDSCLRLVLAGGGGVPGQPRGKRALWGRSPH